MNTDVYLFNFESILFKMMESQIQQMKSSIANIQNHLRQLECQQTIKINQPQSNILPQSILEEEVVYQNPIPAPKITQTIPNIIRTDIYTPNRHHLDDTEMKNALRDQCASRSINRSNKKQKSLTLKTKYVYDGARVVYIPPLLQTQSDYGHIVVQTDKKKSKNNESTYKSYDVFQDYGMNPKPKTHKKKRVVQKIQNEQSKITKMKPIGNTKVGTLSSAYKNRSLDQSQQQIKRIKSIKTQCNLIKQKKGVKKIRIKQPFPISWNADTDSDFSGLSF